MMRLHQIETEVRQRTGEIVAVHSAWPCRKGCDDCCRRLASEPRVSRDEWLQIANAIDALPSATAETVKLRIREGRGRTRPLVCPLLDGDSGTCLVYEARPVACRAYGFYVERGNVLGCYRIESLAQLRPDIVWGNHAVLEERLRELGPAKELSDWLDAGPIA